MITQEQIQSIVDGECSHASRAMLLHELESQPSAWRTLALALLEEQEWSKQIPLYAKSNTPTHCSEFASDSHSSKVAMDSKGSADVQPFVHVASLGQAGHSHEGSPGRTVPWLSALAASMLLGLGFYGGSFLPNLSVMRSDGGKRESVADSKKGETPSEKSASLANDMGTDMRMLVSGPNRERAEIPIFDLNATDHDVFVAREMYELARINQRLRKEGFELDVRPEYYTGKLNDGRQLVVPVKHVGLKPYGL